MSTSIEQILKIYSVKPKKGKRQKKGKGVATGQKTAEVKRMHSLERISDPSPDSKKRMRSLEPTLHRKTEGAHAFSLKSLPESSSLNTSLEESFERLEKLMSKSTQARSSRLNLQVQMLKLGVSEIAQGGRLAAIAELDDLHADEVLSQRKTEWTPADALVNKYEMEAGRKQI